MYRVPIKPLSVNRSYQGRRFATPELKAYKEQLGYLLPKLTITKDRLKVHYIFGVSSKASEGDRAEGRGIRGVRDQRRGWGREHLSIPDPITGLCDVRIFQDPEDSYTFVPNIHPPH
jgi:hypothetical protein